MPAVIVIAASCNEVKVASFADGPQAISKRRSVMRSEKSSVHANGKPIVQSLRASITLSLFGILCAGYQTSCSCLSGMSVLRVVALHGREVGTLFSEPGLGARMSISFTSKGVVRRSKIHFSARCWTVLIELKEVHIADPAEGFGGPRLRRHWFRRYRRCSSIFKEQRPGTSTAMRRR